MPLRVNVIPAAYGYFIEIANAYSVPHDVHRKLHLERAARLARGLNLVTIAHTIDSVTTLAEAKWSIRHAQGYRSGDGRAFARLHQRFSNDMARTNSSSRSQSFGR